MRSGHLARTVKEESDRGPIQSGDSYGSMFMYILALTEMSTSNLAVFMRLFECTVKPGSTVPGYIVFQDPSLFPGPPTKTMN
jgi:hypothetical protein